MGTLWRKTLARFHRILYPHRMQRVQTSLRLLLTPGLSSPWATA